MYFQKEHYMNVTLQAVICCVGVIYLISMGCSPKVEYDRSYTWFQEEVNQEAEGSEMVQHMINPYKVKMDSVMNEVIGYAAQDLTLDGKYESTLGAFVTRLLKVQSTSFFEMQVDLAVMNHHGGLRSPIIKGPVTLREVYEVMPFENEMLLLEIPGDRLTEVIRFVGESGHSMIWPVAFNISSMGVENIKVNGKDVLPERKYTLAVSDYLANGGAGFEILKSFKRLTVDSIKLRDMIELEIRQCTANGDSIKVEITNMVTISEK